MLHRAAEPFIGDGLQPAGFVHRLFRGHFLVDQMGRDDGAVAVSLGIAKRLDVHVEPVLGAVHRTHPHALTDGLARTDLPPAVGVGLHILGRDELPQSPAQPMLLWRTQYGLHVR